MKFLADTSLMCACRREMEYNMTLSRLRKLLKSFMKCSVWPNLDLGQKPNKHFVLQSVHLNQQSHKVSIHIEVVLLHKCKRIMPIFISITHTGCRAFTSKAIQCKNKNQFCSTSLVIPVHEALVSESTFRKGMFLL